MQKVHSAWEANLNRISSLMETDDISNFLNWDAIKATMFVDYPHFVQHWLPALIGTPYENLLQEPVYGNPGKSDIWGCSYNRIAQVNHLYNYELESGKKVKDFDYIIEFGGGYGSLCEIIHKSGFKGKYIIYDLPRVSEIQSYYLSSCGLSVRLTNSLSVFKSSFKNSMFISNWALSESPKEVQDIVLNSKFFQNVNHMLMVIQHSFSDINNTELINNIPNRVAFEVPNLPNSNYLIR